MDEGWFPPEAISVADGRLTLIGACCSNCGNKCFPHRETCPACGAVGMTERVPLTRRGRLYAFTTTHQAARYFTAPYTVGYVDLDDGVRVFSHIAGSSGELAVDQLVEVMPAALPVGEKGADAPTFQFGAVQ